MPRLMLLVWALLGLLVIGIIVAWLASAAEGADLPPAPLVLPGAQAPCYQSNDEQAKRVTVRCKNGLYVIRRDDQAKAYVIEAPDHTIKTIRDRW